MTWTLETMRNFVLHRRIDVQCLSCKGSNRGGTFSFRAVLVMYPEFNTETCDEDVHVGVDVMFDSQSCFCKGLTEHEIEVMQKEAHDKVYEQFKDYLHRLSPSPLEVMV